MTSRVAQKRRGAPNNCMKSRAHLKSDKSYFGLVLVIFLQIVTCLNTIWHTTEDKN